MKFSLVERALISILTSHLKKHGHTSLSRIITEAQRRAAE